MKVGVDSVNLAIGVAGFTICVLGLLMAAMGSMSEKRTKRFFILIFSFLVAYVASDLIGQLGSTGGLRKIALFFESALSSVLTLLLTVFLLEQSGERKWPANWAFRAAAALWLLYMGLLVYTQFSTIIYYYDAQGIYHRGPFYPLLLLSPLCIMALNLTELWRRRAVFSKKQRLAFAVYIIAPMLTMLIQMAFFGVYVIILGTSVSALFMFLYIQRDLRERYVQYEKENAQLKINLLLAQIQPHFLYNTLGTIQAIIRRDPETADRAVTEFSAYLRYNMDSLTLDRPISFSEELKHVRHYLYLQRLRFQDELQVEYDLECTDFSLPALTLQPLVENAVTHGIRRSESGTGTVTIRSRRFPDRVELSVADNGPGFDPDMPRKDDSRSHTGIQNVRERLKHISGGALRVDAAPGKGTVVTVLLPQEERPC